MQAAVGVAQLEHLDDFIAARRRNFARLREGLAHQLQNVLDGQFDAAERKVVRGC